MNKDIDRQRRTIKTLMQRTPMHSTKSVWEQWLEDKELEHRNFLNEWELIKEGPLCFTDSPDRYRIAGSSDVTDAAAEKMNELHIEPEPGWNYCLGCELPRDKEYIVDVLAFFSHGKNEWSKSVYNNGKNPILSKDRKCLYRCKCQENKAVDNQIEKLQQQVKRLEERIEFLTAYAKECERIINSREETVKRLMKIL
jgi:hypothetical protein